MTFDYTVLVRYAPQLIAGLEVTVSSWLMGSLLAMLLGFVLALPLSFRTSALAKAVRLYIEVIRGTPLLVHLFVLYYGGPTIGLTMSAFTVGVVGLMLYGGAYFAEIFRAGFNSVPKGQTEAATSFGFGRAATIRYVLVPQMLALCIPPSTNLLVILLKDSAVLSIITVPELTFQVTGITIETFRFVEPFVALAAAYWLLTEATSLLGRRLEDRIGVYLRA
jgi:polar amino acid transport system permease protein